jgi:hypothetical protein
MLCLARFSSYPPVSVGETQSEGIGRPAPSPRPAPAAIRCPCQSEPTRRIRPSGSQSTLVPRLVATCGTGSGTGGHTSTSRTALGLCPRPVVSHSRICATVVSTHRCFRADDDKVYFIGHSRIERPKQLFNNDNFRQLATDLQSRARTNWQHDS